MQNGFVESFNGRLRDELLNEMIFRGLAHAREVLSDWQQDYNGERPPHQPQWAHAQKSLEVRVGP